MNEIHVFANKQQEHVLRYMIEQNSQAYGFCIRTSEVFPHGQYVLFKISILDAQAAFTFGMLYQKALTNTLK